MEQLVKAQMYTRQHPRVKLDMAVTQLAEHGPYETVLANVSACGALLVDPLVPVFGDAVIRLLIRLPGIDEEVAASGHVVRDWEHEGRHMVAIEFDQVESIDYQLLKDFVAERRGF